MAATPHGTTKKVPAYEVRAGSHVYSNVVQRGCLQQLHDYFPSSSDRTFAVTTEDVWALHGEAFTKAAGERSIDPLFFRGGEVNKTLHSLEELGEQMSKAGADRRSLVIGFGGGIVTDLAGFLASSFMRGVSVLQVPTTLLGQVDAAIGGKTGVNLRTGKNLMGAFHQPLAVLIDPDLLITLPAREMRAGLYEVLKCAVIRDSALFAQMEISPEALLNGAPELLDEAIAGAVRIKAEVVSADERESDLRRILNFGHTVGHALEALTDYTRYLHGEAVGQGMLVETRLAMAMGLLDRADGARICEAIRAFGPLPPFDDLALDDLLKGMLRDKKTVAGSVHFVLPVAIGETRVVSDVPADVLREALRGAV